MFKFNEPSDGSETHRFASLPDNGARIHGVFTLGVFPKIIHITTYNVLIIMILIRKDTLKCFIRSL